MSVGFMAPTSNEQMRQEAWRSYRDMLSEDPRQRRVVRQIAANEGGRELLDASRRAWRASGFEAPFDFVFEAEAHE